MADTLPVYHAINTQVIIEIDGRTVAPGRIVGFSMVHRDGKITPMTLVELSPSFQEYTESKSHFVSIIVVAPENIRLSQCQ